ATKRGRQERAGLARGGAHFSPSGPSPEWSSGLCLRAHSRDWRLSCPPCSRCSFRFVRLGLDELELGVLSLLRGPTQLLAPGCSMPIDFVQNGVATHLCGGNHAIDPFDLVETDG